ncbi:MAG TPA: M28 family metallopeptidase, partial [Kofleriaceae bacterium]|nr:M28 family metallopeptidase [Kofleriaceae bacterium]
DRVLDHVALLAKSPRVHDTAASRAALAYIEHAVGGERIPVGDVALPAIDVLGSHIRDAHVVHTDDPDLVLRFGPSGKALLLTAHYDTVPGSPGATDNAVAVGLLIELARELRGHAPPFPVMLAFTADEEQGLVGAEALARDRDDIGFVIALDLLGGDGALVLNGASTLIGTAEMRWLADAADRAGVIVRAPLPHRVVSRWWPAAERADHGAFTRRGIRAFHLYNRGNDGEWIDLAYHSARDVPARLHRDSLAAAGRLVRALTATPPPVHAGDGYWLPLAVNTVVPRWWLVAGELALVMIVIGALVLSRDGLVAMIARRHERTRSAPDAPRGAGLLLGLLCYVVAAAIAIAVEHATAGEHPAPWLHAPLRVLVADALVLAGAFGLATRVVARFWPWRGDQRYLTFAAITCTAIGTLLVAIGAAELAWIWIVPAAAIALAPRLGRAGVLAVVIAALPVACMLNPWQLREAAWHRFMPALPLALWLAIVGAPTIATAAYYLRLRTRPSGPLGTLVLGMGCGLAVALGLVFAVTLDPPCTPAKFEEFHLACERV